MKLEGDDMSRLDFIFSNIKKTFGKENGKFRLTSPTNLSINEKFERKNIIFGKVLSSLKALRERVSLVEKVPHSSLQYTYFKTEYSKGSFCETITGELLIPDETVSYVKGKVR